MRMLMTFLLPVVLISPVQIVIAQELPAAAGKAAATNTVLVVGDSISAGYGVAKGKGWVNLLQQRLDQQCEGVRVVNVAVSGETTAGGLAALPEQLARYKPSTVVIELGGNDGLQKQSLDKMQDNLQRLVNLSKAAGAKPVLLGMKMPLSYNPIYRWQFERVYTRVAVNSQVPLLPFLLDSVALVPGMMQADGIHPATKAQSRLLDNAWEVVQPLIACARKAPH